MQFQPYLGKEIHFHVTGALSACLVPWWLNWFREMNPDVVVNVSVSRNALRFVSFEAITRLSNGRDWIDDWDSVGPDVPWSSGQSGSSEAIVLFPCSLDTAMKLAGGRSDSPALMMLQITNLPIVIADVFPAKNEIVQVQLQQLSKRNNIKFAPRVSGVSAASRKVTSMGFNLPGAIVKVNEMLKECKKSY